MKRWMVWMVLGAMVLLAAASLAVVGGWRAGVRARTFLTDADRIRVAESQAPVRRVLWQPALPVAGLGQDGKEQYEPRLSADGTRMMFVRGRAGANADLFESRWTPGGWTAPEPISAINTPKDELGPELSRDGTSLWFYSDREGGLGGYDVWVSRRTDSSGGGADWSTPENLGPSINSEFNEYGPAVMPDGSRVYFSSNRPRPGEPGTQRSDWPATVRELRTRHDYDLYRSDLGEFGPVVAEPVMEVNTPFDEGAPVVSPAGDFLWLSSDRPGGTGGFDLYRSRLLRGRILPPENAGAAINSGANDLDPALSADGFRLHFSSDRSMSGESDMEPAASAPAPYALWESVSREVFSEVEPARAGEMLARMWDRAWPWLLALLAALLAGLLLFLALRDPLLRRRLGQLSLLAKCMLASMLIHALLLSLLAVWRVGSAIGEAMRESGGTRVSLGSVGGGGLAAQVRGTLTSVAITAPGVRSTRPDVAAPEIHPDTLASQPLAAEVLVPLARPALRVEDAPGGTALAQQPTVAAADDETATRLPEPPSPAPAVAEPRTDVAAAAPTPSGVRATPQQSNEPASVALSASPAPVEAAAGDRTPAPTPDAASTTASTALAAGPSIPEQGPEAVQLPAAPARARASAAEAEARDAVAMVPGAVRAVDVSGGPNAVGPVALNPERSEVTMSAGPPSQAVDAATAPVSAALAAGPSIPNQRSELVRVPAVATPLQAPVNEVEPRDAAAMVPSAVRATDAAGVQHDVGPVALDPRRTEVSIRAGAPRPAADAATASAGQPAPSSPMPSHVDSGALRQARLPATATPAQGRAEAPTPSMELPSPVHAASTGTGPASAMTVAVNAPAGPVSESAMPLVRPAASEALESASSSARAPPSLASADPSASARLPEVAAPSGAPEAGGGRAQAPSLPGSVRAATAPATAGEGSHVMLAPRAGLIGNPSPTATGAEANEAAPAIERVGSGLLPPTAPPTIGSAAVRLPLSPGAESGHPDRTVAAASSPDNPAVLPNGARPGLTSPPAGPATLHLAPTGERPNAPALGVLPSKAATPAEASSRSVSGPAPSDRAVALSPPTTSLPVRLPAALAEVQPETFAQRAPEVRSQVLERMGGSQETEQAVALALEWFKSHQDADGRWSGQHFDDRCGQCGGRAEIDADAAITGITLLCYVGAGHTHNADGPHRDAVRKALTWLVNRQEPSGDLRRGETMYSQTIAAVALCEAYAMTRDPWLEGPARRAVTFVVRGPEERGADARDTSVLGWQVMAVKSAQRAGFQIPRTTFDQAARWLDQVSQRSSPGRYGYRPGERPSAAATAEAMFVRQLLGHGRDEPRMRESAAFILNTPPAWRNTAPTYYWYYATLALFQQQGDSWKQWNEGLVRELLANQRREGPGAGSWEPQDEWSRLGGRIYQTAVCTLSLEVYYRYKLSDSGLAPSAAPKP